VEERKTALGQNCFDRSRVRVFGTGEDQEHAGC
jgi:hypothetical protein